MWSKLSEWIPVERWEKEGLLSEKSQQSIFQWGHENFDAKFFGVFGRTSCRQYTVLSRKGTGIMHQKLGILASMVWLLLEQSMPWLWKSSHIRVFETWELPSLMMILPMNCLLMHSWEKCCMSPWMWRHQNCFTSFSQVLPLEKGGLKRLLFMLILAQATIPKNKGSH